MKPSKYEIKKRDRLHQAAIVKRENGICILHNTIQRSRECAGSFGIAAPHILKKLTIESRYNPKMSAALCLNCHRWAEDNPWDAIPLIVACLILKGIINDKKEFEDLVRASKQNISIDKRKYPGGLDHDFNRNSHI